MESPLPTCDSQPDELYDGSIVGTGKLTAEFSKSAAEFVLMQDHHGYEYLSLCEWSVSNALSQSYGIAIDLRFSLPERHHPGSLPLDLEQNSAILGGSWAPLQDALIAAANAADGETDAVRTIRIIVPTSDGFVAQRDWIQRRLVDCKAVEKTVCFLNARAPVTAYRTSALNGPLRVLLDAACAGILLAASATLEEVNDALAARLTSAWIVPVAAMPRFRLAVVDGRRHRTVSSAGEGVYRAAAGLDIGLVVLDRAGHWLETSEESHLCDQFLPIDMTMDEGLVERIVDAVRGLAPGVDGIITWTDAYLLPVAKAAVLLGLPCTPPQAVATCVDKSLTRLLLNPDSCQSYTFSTDQELEAVIAEHAKDMCFPFVLKPCSGTSSEGVSKVRNMQELRSMALRNLHSPSIGGKYGCKMMLETFVDGPEVDVNLTMLDGEVIFSEISDDFPSPADSKSCDMMDTFVDTGNAMPSALVAEEQRMLVDTCHRILLGMNISSGIFHFEARVTHSSKAFTERHGLLDLTDAPRHRGPVPKPGCFVIEVNVRMPGNMGSGLIERLWGVDYYSLYMLFAVRDIARVRALAKPYPSGPQYHAQVLRLSATKGGVWASTDPCGELLEAVPELRGNVVHYRNLYQRGMVVPDPVDGVVVCVAFFYIVSRESREELLWASQRVADLFDYEVQPCEGTRTGFCMSKL